MISRRAFLAAMFAAPAAPYLRRWFPRVAPAPRRPVTLTSVTEVMKRVYKPEHMARHPIWRLR